MAEGKTDIKSYIETRVIFEKKPITFRLLSRECNIHVNLAKQLLYQFHISSKEAYPGELRCTFLLAGVKFPGVDLKAKITDISSSIESCSTFADQRNDEANEIHSQITFEIVREEDLPAAKKEFKYISAMHVYALAPIICSEITSLYMECSRQTRIFDLQSGICLQSGAISNNMAIVSINPLASTKVEPDIVQDHHLVVSDECKISSDTEAISSRTLDSREPNSGNDVPIAHDLATATDLHLGGVGYTRPKKVKLESSRPSRQLQSLFSDDHDSQAKRDSSDTESTDIPYTELIQKESDKSHEDKFMTEITIMKDTPSAEQNDLGTIETAPIITNRDLEKTKKKKRKIEKETTYTDDKGFSRVRYETVWESCSDESELDIASKRYDKPQSNKFVTTRSATSTTKKENSTKSKKAAQRTLRGFFSK
ncbi:DNA polymerase subunit Cdc27-domain-containing protein [Dipodascopsis uninucleata]